MNKDINKYINRSFEKNINIINHIKKNKISNFLYNFYGKNILDNSDLDNVIKVLNKKNLKLHDLNNYKDDYEKGVLATFLKLCHYTYYYKYIEKSFFKFRIVFRNNEIIVTELENSLFISLRGTNIYSQIEYFHNLTFYKKNIDYVNEESYKNFLKWKTKLLKTYPIEKILSRKIISDLFRFHGGLLELYRAYKIFPKIKSILEKYKKYKNIYLVGHSMGASFVNLLIIDLFNLSKNLNRKFKINAVTFGAPGCMNSNLSLFYLYLTSINFISKYIRIHNKNDVISATFSNQEDYFTSFIGLLRHINSSVLKKNKNIISKNTDNCLKKFLIYNTEKNIKNFESTQFNYQEIHNLFCFSTSKKAILFSL